MKKIKTKKLFSLICAVLIFVSATNKYVKAKDKTEGPFQLPKLPYSYDALEPYIDAKTMEIHYLKHHGTYVEKLNEAVNKYPELKDKIYRRTLN